MTLPNAALAALVVIIFLVTLNQYYLLNQTIISTSNDNAAATFVAPTKPFTEEALLREIDANPTLLKKIISRETKKNDLETKVDSEEEKDEISSIDATDDNDVCSALNLSSSSTSFIWLQHLKEIFLASRHAQDNDYTWHDFTAILLQYITPQRLQTSVSSLPFRYWDKVGAILETGWKRYRHVKQQRQQTTSSKQKQQPEEPRKLNILVMGGSVTMGVQCLNNPVVQSNRFARRNCAWPTRLSIFLNSLFPDTARVDMITLGGTNTESAKTIWDYALFPTDMPYPDILIHAYSTNDMHVISENQAKELGITLEEMILQVNQNFVRAVLQPHSPKNVSSCEDFRPTPLLLYYDDYVGNEQRELLQTRSFGRAASVLANYYGFGLVSYADAVRDLIYSDTMEDWFSPNKWPARQVHPGMGMHISSMWFIAYNLLNMVTSYCSSHNNDELSSSLVEPLRDPRKRLKGRPKGVPLGLPPVLNNKTNLDEISSQWQQAAAASTTNLNAKACEEEQSSYPSRCILSWVGNMERAFDAPAHLEKRLKPFLTHNQDWEANADNSKLGYVATRQGANFELTMKIPESRIVQTLNFMVMTSYGEKWANSTIRVDAYVDHHRHEKEEEQQNIAAVVKTMDIIGYHDRNTSETYNYQLDLEQDTAFSKDIIRVKITLVGGTTFKIMGMAICDH